MFTEFSSLAGAVELSIEELQFSQPEEISAGLCFCFNDAPLPE